jgi:osmotically-inducible protein OsmY
MIEEAVSASGKPVTGNKDRVSLVVEEMIGESFRTSGYPALRSVVCQYHEGVAVLYGRVPSFYMKQIAQTLVSKIPGVDVIANRLRVDDVTSGR